MTLTPDQMRRLSKIANRSTSYEVVVVRSDGTCGLVCYIPGRSRRNLERALYGRSDGVLSFLGASDVTVTYAKDGTGENILNLSWPSGSAVVRFSHRTRRDVIMGNNPLPFVGIPNAKLAA